MRRKIILIPGIIILLIVLFVLQDVFLAPADKKVFFRPPVSSRTNKGSTATPTVSDYKNSISLNWTRVNWADINNVPTSDFPIIPENGSVYMAGNVTYCTSNGSNLSLDLYSNKPPAQGGLKPMVIYIHGGGLVSGDKRQIDGDISPVLLGLINNGFIVASVNYEIAPQYKYPAMIQDVLCSVRFMKYYAYGIGGNQNKIGIFGDSTGGQLGSLVGVTNGVEAWETSGTMQIAGVNLTNDEYLKIPTKPNAVVDYYGGTELPESPIMLFMMEHFIGGFHNPATGQTQSMGDLMKEIYNSDSTLMHEASAINYVSNGEPPFFIAQGDKDTLNPENLSVDFYNKLKSNNNDVTLLIVKNADHRFVPNPPNAIIEPSLETIVNTTINFFESNLQ